MSRLPIDSKYDVLDRFQAKFLERENEKMDRLMDLIVAYYERAMATQFAPPSPPSDNDHDDDDDDSGYAAAMEAYRLHQLDHGLFTLQQVCLVLAHMCQVFSRTLLPLVKAKLHVHGLTVATIAQVLMNQINMMDRSDEHQAQRDRLEALTAFLNENQDE